MLRHANAPAWIGTEHTSTLKHALRCLLRSLLFNRFHRSERPLLLRPPAAATLSPCCAVSQLRECLLEVALALRCCRRDQHRRLCRANSSRRRERWSGTAPGVKISGVVFEARLLGVADVHAAATNDCRPAVAAAAPMQRRRQLRQRRQRRIASVAGAVGVVGAGALFAFVGSPRMRKK